MRPIGGWALAVALVVVVGVGCGSGSPAVSGSVDFRTATPTDIHVDIGSWPSDSGLNLAELDTRADTTPTVPPFVENRAQAAQEGAGVPWYVPAGWEEEWTACLARPDRYALEAWIGTVGWPVGEARAVTGREGGSDLCQFNTQGSGACGPFQDLPCPGLDWGVQIATSFGKWEACGGSFECGWYRWWR